MFAIRDNIYSILQMNEGYVLIEVELVIWRPELQDLYMY